MQANLPLEKLLEIICQNAAKAWPSFEIEQGHFVAHAERCLQDAASPIELARKINGKDLYLACACMHGNSTAIQYFVEEVLAKVSLSHVASSDADAQDVRQVVADRLLVPAEGHKAKISEYAGRGSLASWVQVVAVRIAIDLHRRRGPNAQLDSYAMNKIGATDEVELEYLKGRYRDEFRSALEDAFAALSKRERSFLRLNVVEQLNIAEIGKLYSVHRATVARSIADARKLLFAQTRKGLDERLRAQLSPSEFEDLVQLVMSQMDLSIQRLLES